MTPDAVLNGGASISEYYEWFDSAQPGQTLQYYVGDLRFDRAPEHFGHLTPDERQRIDLLNTLANAVLRHARENRLHLTQCKLADNFYQYMATKRPVEAVREVDA